MLAGAVAAVEAAPHVTYVTTPTRVAPTAEERAQGTPGAEVAITNAEEWHAAGIDGAGTKVGIIDTFDGATWLAAAGAGDLGGGPAGAFCRWAGAPCDIWGARSEHGVAVAEVVHEMAPGAQIYIADALTTADFQAAVDWFHSQGVQIITRSQTAEYDGPGDGTGGVADVIDDAVAKGMVYVNSAGNNGGTPTRSGSYWRGPWTDTDNDGWLDFAPGDELLATTCWYFNGLRWDDWAGNATDYDVVLYDMTVTPPVPISQSIDDQRSGAPPIERLNTMPCRVRRAVGVAVYRYHAGNGTTGDVMELMVNGAGLERWSNPHAAAAPMADSANPGTLSVGAIDPPGGTAIASYSSQGPTNDGRVKPDLAAPACVATTSYGEQCFNGTSASTPAAAGALALALDAGMASTPAGLAGYLRTATQDRGAAGTDNVYGRGMLRLPVGSAAPFTSLGRLIDRQYLDLIGRAPTASERATWNQRLLLGTRTRADLVASLRSSNENRANVDPVTRLYRAAFLRVPDATGLQYWIERKRAGASLSRISGMFAASAEFARRYGALSDAELVDLLYRNVLGRPADDPGLAFWTGELRSGRRSRGRVMVGFSESAEYAATQAKVVNVSVIVIQMLGRAPSAAELTTLLAGPSTSTVLAEYAFTRPEYAAS
ncbi:MAG TPA: DUF4214 domain-containing protein [Acidimicrobiales bacterium]|nr:DUF4214 domain-containing protein [Acidimicrobiales bacterium]